jgi:hypothetical protein
MWYEEEERVSWGVIGVQTGRNCERQCVEKSEKELLWQWMEVQLPYR